MKLSELFAPGKDTLAIYSFMFGPERAEPCPGCTHFLDAADGAALHAAERINFVVVAKSPLKRLLDLAKQRGWQHLRLLSTAGNTYDRDYYGDSTALSEAMRDQQEFKPGEEWDMPILNVFRREEDGTIRHFWASELLYVPAEPGQEYRHNDLLDPLWNMFDVTPEGRGDFHPKVHYLIGLRPRHLRSARSPRRSSTCGPQHDVAILRARRGPAQDEVARNSTESRSARR